MVETASPHTRISKATKNKILNSKSLLDQEQAQVIEELHPVEVSVRTIRKRPIQAIRRAPQRILPSRALFGLSSTGGSILEIITDSYEKPGLAATLQVLEVEDNKEFDVFDSAIRKNHNEEDEKKGKVISIETITQRVGSMGKI